MCKISLCKMTEFFTKAIYKNPEIFQSFYNYFPIRLTKFFKEIQKDLKTSQLTNSAYIRSQEVDKIYTDFCVLLILSFSETG